MIGRSSILREEAIIVVFAFCLLFLLAAQVVASRPDGSMALWSTHLCMAECKNYNSLVMNCSSQFNPTLNDSFQQCLCSAGEFLDTSVVQCFQCSHYWVNSTQFQRAVEAVVAPCNLPSIDFTTISLESSARLVFTPSMASLAIGVMVGLVGILSGWVCV